MTKALLRVRFRALFHSMLRQSRQKRRHGTGMTVLFILLFAYVGVVFCGMFALMFSKLAPAYHTAGLDWLYFATAGLMALGLSVFGSVFATQSQIYDAKDNGLLLSMPIPPRTILLSRVLPLMVLNGVFSLLVLGPAGVVYGTMVGYTPVGLVAFVLCCLAVIFLSQALCCLLGWLLHLLLSRINKSLASAVYMVLFLGIYFYLYSQAGNILNAMAAEGASMASALQSWAWPLYAMGRACTGSLPFLAAFLVICTAVSGLAYWFLSATFLGSAAMQHTGRRKKVDYGNLRAGSTVPALMFTARRRCLGCPVYLTNMGLGLVMILALAIAGAVFRKKVLEFFNLIPGLSLLMPLLICAVLGFLVSSTCISTPSGSLEGKSIWILKSLPLAPRQILLAKLRFHNVLVVPIAMASGLILSLAYGCGPVDTLLVTVFPGLLGLLCGLLGASGLADGSPPLQAICGPGGHHAGRYGLAPGRRPRLRLPASFHPDPHRVPGPLHPPHHPVLPGPVPDPRHLGRKKMGGPVRKFPVFRITANAPASHRRPGRLLHTAKRALTQEVCFRISRWRRVMIRFSRRGM